MNVRKGVLMLIAGITFSVMSATCGAQSIAPARLEQLDDLASHAQNNGHYKEALKYRRELLQAINRISGFPENERARQMSNLGSILNLLGRPKEALAIELRAQEILKSHPSHDPVQYAVLYGNIARSEALEGGFLEAEENYGRALSVLKSSIGVDNVFAALDKVGLAQLYARQIRYAAAARYYQEAYDVSCEARDPPNGIKRLKRHIQSDYLELVKLARRTRSKNAKASDRSLNLTAPPLRCGASA